MGTQSHRSKGWDSYDGGAATFAHHGANGQHSYPRRTNPRESERLRRCVFWCGEVMTATPNFASGAGAEAGSPAAPALSTGPFVLNLCSSTTPMALAQTDLPELRRFTFFISRRFEEGRERFRLHMGYFATLAEAEEWLGLAREIYPGAWAGETPGRKLRERATAAAAAQAQHAAGPQTRVPPVAAAAPAARPAPPRPLVTPPAPTRVPVVHAAPAVARNVSPAISPPPARPAA